MEEKENFYKMNRNLQNLTFIDGKPLQVHKEVLQPLIEELQSLLNRSKELNNLDFAKEIVFGQELRANFHFQEFSKSLLTKEEQRLKNLYKTYQYILNHEQITKNSLKEIYNFISKNCIEEDSKLKTGEFYRQREVYISYGNSVYKEPFYGISHDIIENYMQNLLDYINTEDKKNEIEVFLKSQIIHFYLLYIHPYLDCNGRMSRMLSSWYLLNQKAYALLAFNQAISFSASAYEKSLIKARVTLDVTPFLKYIIEETKKELERMRIIKRIEQTTSITKEEGQILEYFLLTKNQTAKDLAQTYNRYNQRKRPYSIYEEKIEPLVVKGLLQKDRETKGWIKQGIPNYFVSLNPQVLRREKRLEE